MSFVVIVPTYNEAENISSLIDRVMSLARPFHLLVVDDNSTDGTQDLVATKQRQYPDKVFILHRAKKMGLGSAYIHGFKWALDKGYMYISEMDADFSHPIAKLEDFYQKLESAEADVVVGSRYVKGGKIENWPFTRKLISYGGSIYARVLTGLPVRDTTAGFIAYHRKVLERINFDSLSAQGYVFQVEIKLAAWLMKFNIVELPITFVDRVLGSSKMNSGIIKEAMWRIFKIALRIRFGNYKTYISKTC